MASREHGLNHRKAQLDRLSRDRRLEVAEGVEGGAEDGQEFLWQARLRIDRREAGSPERSELAFNARFGKTRKLDEPPRKNRTCR